MDCCCLTFLFAIPIVGEFLKKTVDKLYEISVGEMFRNLGYIYHYRTLEDNFERKIEQLGDKARMMSKSVKTELESGKVIHDEVHKWQEKAREILESPELSASCKCSNCLSIPNPFSCLNFGSNPEEKIKTVADLIVSGTDLLGNAIATLPKASNLPIPDAAFQKFASRENAYKKILEAVVSGDDFMILGIYGLPGAGKTRMMQQIWEESIRKKTFNKVALAVVSSSESLDVIHLQNQIASHIGCDFVSKDNERLRADQLKRSLKNGGKVLIILDDVWSTINLKDIFGTTFREEDHSWKGCKLLFTSRNHQVCLKNKCKTLVEVTSLTENEAWELFSSKVGSLKNEPVARAVCKECGGLPLLLDAVADALTNASSEEWSDALVQLQNSKIEDVPNITRAAYRCLQLSFKRLKHDDARACLFLGSLFPEDADIHIWKLIQIATGSHLVDGGSGRICSMINILKSSSLLLRGTDGEHFKMHDTIRDVARSEAIASDKYAFLFEKCDPWLPYSDARYRTRGVLHLDLENNGLRVGYDPVCSELHTLSLRSNHKGRENPNKALQAWAGKTMFANINLLVLMNFNATAPISIRGLKNLRTLILDNCSFGDPVNTDVRYYPDELESICIWDCLLPNDFDIVNLKSLRKLEILWDRNKEVIGYTFPCNTLCKLTCLQELHAPGGIHIHDYESNPGRNPELTKISALTEISALANLKSLQLWLNDLSPLSDAAISSKLETVFSNLTEYNIIVGYEWLRSTVSPVSSTRIIEFYECNQLEGVRCLIERANEVVFLNSDVPVSTICDSNRDAFADLQNLYIKDCDNVEHLMKISQDATERSLPRRKHFFNLVSLVISDCSKMEYLFCGSVAKSLELLQNLFVTDCGAIKIIVTNEGTSNGEIIRLSKLKSLRLAGLPKLTSFYGVVIPSILSQPLFDGKVAFPSLEILELHNLKEISDIWGNDFYGDNVSSFIKLNTLEVSECEKLRTATPLPMLPLPQDSLIPEVSINGSNAVVHPLLALRDMLLMHLPLLKSTWLNSGDHSVAASFNLNLENLRIQGCDSLVNVFLPCIARNLEHLKTMNVDSCHVMEEIIGAGEQPITGSISFSKLTVLKLTNLPKLRSFRNCQSGEAGTCQVEFPSIVHWGVSCSYLNLEAIELGKDDSTCPLLSLDISYNYQLPLPSNWHTKLFNLESLRLVTCCYPELYNQSFQRLKVFKASGFGERSTLFSFSAFASLQHLQELEISNSSLLEEIVEDVRGDESSALDKKIITLPQLKSIVLRDLPKVNSFFHTANFECRLPTLKEVVVDNCKLSTLFTCSILRSLRQLNKLEVLNCEMLEGIVEDLKANEISGIDKKAITLPQLKSVFLIDLPKLKCFVHSTYYECYVPALEDLVVDNCALSALFTCSVLENLQNLRDLLVSNCKLLEGIVEDSKTGETSDTNIKIIELFQLNVVVLSDLPKLKSFMHGANYECHMPALSNLEVISCGLSILFSCSDFKIVSSLCHLQVSKCMSLKGIVEDVRSDEISHTDDQTITFPLISIELTDLPELRSFSSTASYGFEIPELNKFSVIRCPKIEKFSSTKASVIYPRFYSHLSHLPFADLNEYIQYLRTRNEVSASAGESSYSRQVERVEEEQSQTGKNEEQ